MPEHLQLHGFRNSTAEEQLRSAGQSHRKCFYELELLFATLRLRWPKVWALSRRVRNRIQKAMRGNLKVTVANITAVSNLRLVVSDDPDVILVQELWATKLQPCYMEQGLQPAGR